MIDSMARAAPRIWIVDAGRCTPGGTVPLARAPLGGCRPAPRDSSEEPCGSWDRSSTARPGGPPLLDRARLVAPGGRDEQLGAVVVHDGEGEQEGPQHPEQPEGHHRVVVAGVRADQVRRDAGPDQQEAAGALDGERAAAAPPQREAEGPPRRRVVAVEPALAAPHLADDVEVAEDEEREEAEREDHASPVASS